MTIAIVGASLSGFHVLRNLRQLGYAGEVVLVDGDPDPGYDHPPLSKGILDGTASADRVRLFTPETLRDLNATWQFGSPAVGLDTGAQRLTLSAGTVIDFDALVIATGVAPVNPWGGTDRVQTLRTLADAVSLRTALGGGDRLVIVGGGLIGSEVAAVATASGSTVTVVEPEPTLMYRALGAELGSRVTDAHARRGTRLRLGTTVSSIDLHHGRPVVMLADGEALATDRVLVSIGARPSAGWLEDAGLLAEDGVHVDSSLRVPAAANIFATGDVARWHSRRYGRSLRLEHWTSAVEQARTVAHNLMGDEREHDALPYFWSDQHGARIQVAGLIGENDKIESVENSGSERFAVMAWRAGVPSAVASWGAPRAFVELRRRLDEPRP